MALIWEPLQPWQWVVTMTTAAAVLALILRWRTLGRHRRTRFGVVGLSALVALLLMMAAWNPVLVQEQDPGSVHLSIAVDVSDSVLRTEGGWAAVQERVGQLIESSVEALAPGFQEQGTASIVTFGTGSNVAVRSVSLSELPQALKRLKVVDFAADDGTDIAEGLRRAGEQISRVEERGAILLVSDGNQTQGSALPAAQRLARSGVPVHVLPVTSQGPAMAITAANLPRQVSADAQTFLRGLLHNGISEAARAQLTLQQNTGIAGSLPRSSVSISVTQPIDMQAGAFARLHVPVEFQGVGLQFLDLALTPEGSGGTHRRRFFTHVTQPPRIVAIGGDNRWTTAIPTGAAVIEEMTPEEFSAEPDLTEVDAVVVSEVLASEFTPAALSTIAEAVQRRGLGLLMMNGDHNGADEQTETVLMSYNDTPLEPLLPLSSRPRPFEPEPPSRQVVILMDASGSMSGDKLAKAQEIAIYVVRNLLRPQDHLDVLVFTTDAVHLVDDMRMNEDGKREAMIRIASVSSGGGTDPTLALSLIAERKMSNCGLIFLSDGEFETVAFKPECRATVFDIGHESVPPGSPLWQLADPFPVTAAFDPASIKIPYFEPEKRDKFFEPGEFVPLSTERLAQRADNLPVPGLQLDGSAVTYAKDEAAVIARRPKLTDPILAYQEAGSGYIGALTTAIPDAWLADENASQAVAAWIRRVIPYSARDRYDFQLTDQGSRIEVKVALAAQDGKVPNVNQLRGDIETEMGVISTVTFRADPTVPGTFVGYLDKPADGQAAQVVLELQEKGPDALTRPQRIPLFLPATGEVEGTLQAEAYSFGLNETLLRSIAESGGGIYDPPDDTPLFRATTIEQQKKALWPALVVVAALSYLAAIAVRRFEM